MENDPLTGEPVEVLWVKGSGGDLRTSLRENFSSLYQDKARRVCSRFTPARADKGLKTPAEDEMVGMYTHTTFNLNPRASLDRHAAAQLSSPASTSITCTRTRSSRSPRASTARS